jgi:hypothetical protein
MARTKLDQDVQIRQSNTFDDDLPFGPTLETDAASLQDDLNAIRSQVKRGFGLTNWHDEPVAVGGGWIYIENITVAGGESVTNRIFQDDPANTVLQSATVSTGTMNIVVRASYPLVRVAGVDAELTRVSGAYYSGSVPIMLGASGPIEAVVLTPDGEDGALDTCDVTLDLPPAITAAAFTGPYPTGPGGLQTEVKAGDTFQVQVTADKAFDQVDVQDFGAGISQQIAVPSGLSATVSITIANRGTAAQALAARVRVRDSVTAAYSATRDTNFGGGTTDGVHVVTLNNLHPSGAVSLVVYPGGQGALKGVESATVINTAADYNSIAYSDPTAAQLSIANPAVFEGSKSVTCTAGAIYNGATTNFRYLMTRNANGAQTTVNAVVIIANVAPTIMVMEPAARLRSGGNNGTAAQDHVITLSSNQPLLSAPALDADSGGSRGTFLGMWAGGPSVWTRSLRVSELVPDEKGTFTWEALLATGLAGLTQSTISGDGSYALGGMVQRDLTFAAFATTTAIGAEVSDFSKVQAGQFTATASQSIRQPIGTAPPVINGYTIDAVGVNPTTLIWLDTVAAGTNSGGTAQLLAFEETI